jgi:excinuclease UvrABC helicase subunit UvrB
LNTTKVINKTEIKNKIMFGNRRSYNDIFRAFDEMFSQFDSLQGEWKSQSRVSDDGTIKVTTYYRGGDSSKETGGLQSLKSQLEKAIENEDFESAVKLRDQIKNFEKNQKTIEKLESDLKKSIENQEFEKSIQLRDQIKDLKK